MMELLVSKNKPLSKSKELAKHPIGTAKAEAKRSWGQRRSKSLAVIENMRQIPAKTPQAHEVRLYCS